MGIIYRNGRPYSGGGSGGDAGVELSLAEYNALSEAEKMNGTVYYVKTGGTTQLAQHVGYDNSTSGLEATDVQEAIDELATSGIASSDVMETVYSNKIIPFTPTANDYTVLDTYTIEEDGYYYCECQVTLVGNTSNTRMLVRLYSDDNAMNKSSENCPTAIYKSVSVEGLAMLTKGTVITLDMYSDTAVQHDASNILIKIHKISNSIINKDEHSKVLWQADTYSEDTTITLPAEAADYDEIELFTYYNANMNQTYSIKLVKGCRTQLNVSTQSNTNLQVIARGVTLSEDGLTITLGDAWTQVQGSSGVNVACFHPYKVVGRKLSVSDAATMNYDNTESGLSANNVQDAVDEINSALSNTIQNATVFVSGNAVEKDGIIFVSANLVKNGGAIRVRINDMIHCVEQNGSNVLDTTFVRSFRVRAGDVVVVEPLNNAIINSIGFGECV